MTSRSWSVGRRITGWFVMTTVVLVLAIAGTSAFYMRLSLDRELDALAREEQEEMRVNFSVSEGRPEDVRSIALRLAADHPATPLAWRVWDREGRIWGSFGRLDLLERMPATVLDPRRNEASVGYLRLKVDDLRPALRMGLVIDGSAQYGLLLRYGLSAFALLGLAALLAMLIGAILGNRVSGVVRQVAASVRDLDSPLGGTALEVTGAPDEIREVTDAFQETLEKIRRQSERTRLLTAGLAHELRSPIQNLLGETEVALMREREPEEYRRVLDSTIEELRDLARVVDNLVLLCAAGESDGAVERFDLGSEAELRLEKETQRADERGVHVDFEQRGDLEVLGDREALVLALRNLLSNAVRWSPVGGRVRVMLAGSPERVEIVVDDDGPGVDEAERAKIFEPFYRGRPGAGERAGYGLGLALARAAVQGHGGSIDVENAPSGGARFRMDLPRRERREQAPGGTRSAGPASNGQTP